MGIIISFVLLISGLFNATQSEEISYYLDLLRQGEQTTYAAWAVNEISFQSCENLQHLKAEVKTHPLGNIFGSYSCTDTDTEDALNKLKTNAYLELARGLKNPELYLIYLIKKLKADELDITISPDEFFSDLDMQSDRLSRFATLSEKIYSVSPITQIHLNYNESPLIHFELLLLDNDLRFTIYNIEYLRNALDSWLKFKDGIPQKEIMKSVVYANMLSVAYMDDRYEVIFNNYDEYLSMKNFPDIQSKLRVLNTIDYGLYVQGFYDLALEVQRKHAIPLAQSLDDQLQLDKLRMKQGVYLFSLGKYEESLGIFESLYQKSAYPLQQYSLFTNLGVNYLQLGQNQKYISYQLRALEDENSRENYKSLLSIYHNLFIYYTSVKDINTALKYIDEAKKVAESNNDITEFAHINLYLGSFYWATEKDASKALPLINEAQEILNPEANYDIYVQLLSEKGLIYKRIDSLTLSENVYHQLKELTLKKSDNRNYLDALVNLTDINLRKNNLDKATALLDELKAYSTDALDFEDITNYHTIYAKYLSFTEQNDVAISYLEPVINQLMDRIAGNSDIQGGFWTVREEYLDVIQFMTDLYISENMNWKALQLLDQFKSINDASFYNNPLVKARVLSEADLSREKKLSNQLQILQTRYLNANDQDRFSIKKQIDQISAERDQILNKVSSEKLRSTKPLWLIQRKLSKGELVLHYTEIGSHFYKTILTSEDITIEKKEFLDQQRDLFSTISEELASGKTDMKKLYQIYSWLGLGTLNEEIHTVHVVPDAFLYRIPLDILPINKPRTSISFGSSKFLVENHRFNYFTSLREFEDNRRSAGNQVNNTFSVFAISDFNTEHTAPLPSLPFAIKEAESIKNTLNSFSQNKIYVDADATKEAFKKSLSTSKIVHVATHSEISEQDPLFSKIHLYDPDVGKNGTTPGSDPQDNVPANNEALYAYELFNIPFESEFVMLNSCSSGSGNYMQGTGIMGISRALRFAGAQSMAMNLWSVNDKIAAEFANEVYKHINAGSTKTEAIRQAKLSYLKSGNANPHFWGAYMMIGNPAPLSEPQDGRTYLFGSLLFLSLFIGFVTRKSQQ